MLFLWGEWLGLAWEHLVAGRHLEVPHWLPHPTAAGFTRETLAMAAGQSADWVLPLDDESRLHVHEFSDGHLVAHRDKIDPNRSLMHAVAHIAWETEIGNVALAVCILALGARLLGPSGAR